ncbi:TIGR03086 family metal-binding protein [Actinokineospora sp. NPDC004072]
MDIRDLDRRAIASTGGIIDKLTDDQLDLPTPCEAWTVRDVIAHIVDNNHVAIARVTGHRPEPTGDPRRDFRVSSETLASVYADDAALAKPVEMAVVNTTVPGEVAFGVHFADTLVHGWDLAQAIGTSIDLDPELVQAALDILEGFPHHPAIWSDQGAIFGPRVEAPADADPQVRLLALTGRKADWAA